MIVVGGMIGIGKTTTTKMLEEELSLPSFFETVKGNEILPLFYKATPEEKERKRYPKEGFNEFWLYNLWD